MHVSSEPTPMAIAAQFRETAERMRRRGDDVIAYELTDPAAVGIVIEMPVGQDTDGWVGDPVAWTQYWDDALPNHERPASTTIATYALDDEDTERRLRFSRDGLNERGVIDIDGQRVPLYENPHGVRFAHDVVNGIQVLLRTTSTKPLALKRIVRFDQLIDNTVTWAAAA